MLRKWIERICQKMIYQAFKDESKVMVKVPIYNENGERAYKYASGGYISDSYSFFKENPHYWAPTCSWIPQFQLIELQDFLKQIQTKEVRYIIPSCKKPYFSKGPKSG